MSILRAIIYGSIFFPYIPWMKVVFKEELNWIAELGIGLPMFLMLIAMSIRKLDNLGSLIIAGYFLMHAVFLLLYTQRLLPSVIYLFSIAVLLIVIKKCGWEEKIFGDD
jgi:peptidoglycan biosynthesis protein MviN/MurJ (putative lipid II flippase)